MTTTKKESNPAPEGRVTRIPVGARQILQVRDRDPNFHYRIVNDIKNGSRIQQFKDAGYEFVDSVDTKTGRVDQASDMGSNKTFDVGKGWKAYVMRIPMEFYEQDQAAKQAHLDSLDDALYEGPDEADYGSIKAKRGRAKAIDE